LWRPLHRAGRPLSSARLSQQRPGRFAVFAKSGLVLLGDRDLRLPLPSSLIDQIEIFKTPGAAQTSVVSNAYERGETEGKGAGWCRLDGLSRMSACTWGTSHGQRVAAGGCCTRPSCLPPSPRLAARASAKASPIWHGQTGRRQSNTSKCNHWAIGCNAEARSCVTRDPDVWIAQVVA